MDGVIRIGKAKNSADSVSWEIIGLGFPAELVVRGHNCIAMQEAVESLVLAATLGMDMLDDAIGGGE
jgi:hypothetical protein